MIAVDKVNHEPCNLCRRMRAQLPWMTGSCSLVSLTTDGNSDLWFEHSWIKVFKRQRETVEAQTDVSTLFKRMHGPKHFSMWIRFWIKYGFIVIIACSVFSFINSVTAGYWLTATVSFYPSVHENDCNEFHNVRCTDYGVKGNRYQISTWYWLIPWVKEA